MPIQLVGSGFHLFLKIYLRVQFKILVIFHYFFPEGYLSYSFLSFFLSQMLHVSKTATSHSEIFKFLLWKSCCDNSEHFIFKKYSHNYSGPTPNSSHFRITLGLLPAPLFSRFSSFFLSLFIPLTSLPFPFPSQSQSSFPSFFLPACVLFFF